VTLSQVVTEQQLVEHSEAFEHAIAGRDRSALQVSSAAGCALLPEALGERWHGHSGPELSDFRRRNSMSVKLRVAALQHWGLSWQRAALGGQ